MGMHSILLAKSFGLDGFSMWSEIGMYVVYKIHSYDKIYILLYACVRAPCPCPCSWSCPVHIWQITHNDISCFDGVLEKKFQPSRQPTNNHYIEPKPYTTILVFWLVWVPFMLANIMMETFKLSLFIEKSGTINFNLVHFWRNHDSRRKKIYFSL